MKKIIIIASTILASVSLIGCNTMNNVGQAGTAVVDGGVKVVSTTGRAVGTVVGTGVGVVGTGVTVVGKGVTSVGNTVTRQKVIMRNGQRYTVVNGKYVLVR
ncbi:MAG TPA: hypothetical protein PK657_14685 [Legionella sp.]|nr:hypothetical protein [Legionella sp.]